ncbi:MAG TPA: hypothetical protein VMD47_00920 [Candidatus Acidoferrales bacterium]|nr:hypothetical protein [Candidatus Acidoferrales bacterium]
MSILAAIALVRAFALPVGFTVAPESALPEIVLGTNGTVSAIATSTDRSFRVRAFRWNGAGAPEVFTPLNVLTAPGAQGEVRGSNDPNYRADAAGVASAGQELLVTASTNWSGAYSGTSFEVQRWGRYSAARWPLPSCVDSGDSVDQHAYGGDRDGHVALTIDRTGAGSFQVMQDDPERYAPYAFVIRGSDCRNLGRGVVQSVDGPWAAGYRSYLNGKIAPDNLDTDIQSVVAARWYGEHLQELGPGDALAINAGGFAVGADAVPARTGCTTTNFYSKDHTGQTYCPSAPHAVAWNRAGRRIALAPRSPRSVAYGVSEDGVVVGMLTDAAGRHFAFRWRNGLLQRLDDLPNRRVGASNPPMPSAMTDRSPASAPSMASRRSSFGEGDAGQQEAAPRWPRLLRALVIGRRRESIVAYPIDMRNDLKQRHDSASCNDLKLGDLLDGDSLRLCGGMPVERETQHAVGNRCRDPFRIDVVGHGKRTRKCASLVFRIDRNDAVIQRNLDDRGVETRHRDFDKVAVFRAGDFEAVIPVRNDALERIEAEEALKRGLLCQPGGLAISYKSAH